MRTVVERGEHGRPGGRTVVPEHLMQQIEIETSFGVVAAPAQALVDAIRELLLNDDDGAADDLPEAP
jgi:hypothetical protein